MIRCIATSNLTRSNMGVSSSLNVCCCCIGCEPGRYSTTTITAKQPTRARAQTISNVVCWLAMSSSHNAILAPATVATPPSLTDRLSAVHGSARSTISGATLSDWEHRCRHRQVSVRQSRSIARWRPVILKTSDNADIAGDGCSWLFCCLLHDEVLSHHWLIMASRNTEAFNFLIFNLSLLIRFSILLYHI